MFKRPRTRFRAAWAVNVPPTAAGAGDCPKPSTNDWLVLKSIFEFISVLSPCERRRHLSGGVLRYCFVDVSRYYFLLKVVLADVPILVHLRDILRDARLTESGNHCATSNGRHVLFSIASAVKSAADTASIPAPIPAAHPPNFSYPPKAA